MRKLPARIGARLDFRTLPFHQDDTIHTQAPIPAVEDARDRTAAHEGELASVVLLAGREFELDPGTRRPVLRLRAERPTRGAQGIEFEAPALVGRAREGAAQELGGDLRPAHRRAAGPDDRASHARRAPQHERVQCAQRHAGGSHGDRDVADGLDDEVPRPHFEPLELAAPRPARPSMLDSIVAARPRP